MKESEKKHSSLIIRNPTSLINVGNTLALTNKILTKYSVRIIPYRRYNKWYLFNINMNKIISEDYDSADFLDCHLTSSKSIIVQKNGLSAIYRNESTPTTRNWYSAIKPLKSDSEILIACKDGKFGLISNSDDTLIPFEYELIKENLRFRDLSENGLLCVRKNGYYGIISLKDCSPIINLEYDDITDTGYVGDENILRIKKGDEIGVFSLTTNRILFLGTFEDVSKCNDGICSVKKNGKWLLYNYEGNSFVNNVSYDLTSQFINGFAVCRKEENHFLVNESGIEEIIPIKKSNEGSHVSFERFDDILIGQEAIVEHKQNGNVHFSKTTYVFHVFRGSKQLSNISHKKNSRWCSVRLNKTGLIEILEAGKYGGYYPVKYYNIHGKEVDKNSIQHLNNENKENRSTSSSNFNQSSSWRIDNNKLFYDEKLVFEHPDGELSADLSLDFPKLSAIVDVDPEFGVTSDFVGYIDQKGKMYWEGWSWDDSFDKK